MKHRMLDLFCGRFGWGKAFAERGWEVVGVDLVEPPYIPDGCSFIRADILQIVSSKHGRFSIYECDAGPGTGEELWTMKPDFICASSPCEQFSVHGMKHFHPSPPYPERGIKLFNHTRAICETSGVPYVMENVRAAQEFVGKAVHHCGSFYLWANAVPALIPKAGIISKGIDVGSSKIIKTMTNEEKRAYRAQFIWNQAWSSSRQRKGDTAKAATIPPELANAVCDYAERILEQKGVA